MLQDYVALVDDAELRISLAQKHKCHDIVINVRLIHVYINNWNLNNHPIRIMQSCCPHVMMTDVSLDQSDVPGPEGPAASAWISREGGERIGGGEEDQRAAQQPGEEEEEEEEEESASSSSSCDLTECLFFYFSKFGGRTELHMFHSQTFILKVRRQSLCHYDDMNFLSAHTPREHF